MPENAKTEIPKSREKTPVVMSDAKATMPKTTSSNPIKLINAKKKSFIKNAPELKNTVLCCLPQAAFAIKPKLLAE
jgi:hypothetical protein